LDHDGGGCSAPAAPSAGSPRPRAMLKAPNIIVLMTDQERHHMH